MDDWGGDLALVRDMVATGRYRSHVFDAESSDVAQGCSDGSLEPIDYPRLGLSAQDLLPGAAHPCGVGSVAWSLVLAFDRGRLGDDGPRRWADFFDTARFAGGRGLRRGPLGNLEIALMADGVGPEDVYATLRTATGAERAFAKLAALAPDVTWWEAGGQPARLLADGDAAMTTAWNGRMQRAIASGHGQSRSCGAARSSTTRTGSSRGPSARGLAHRFIAFAMRPDRQAEQARRIPYGPLRNAAYRHVDPDLAAGCPRRRRTWTGG